MQRAIALFLQSTTCVGGRHRPHRPTRARLVVRALRRSRPRGFRGRQRRNQSIPQGRRQSASADEECGLIVQIGQWVLNTACRQYRIWNEADFPNLHIAVNLSERQFRQNNLVLIVAEGVETRDQANFLTKRACNVIQGFMISRPVPADEFLNLLKNRSKAEKPVARSIIPFARGKHSAK